MTLSALLVLGWLGLAPEPPGAVPPPPPATPSTQPVPVPAPPAQPASPATPPRFAFTLGAKSEAIAPCTDGASAKAEDGKAESTAEDNLMKTVLTGAAGANVFLGTTSTAVMSVQVVQEF